ncbi:hypothetical protein DPMN_135204 [Dreissena polymorpha]|uniref:Uncharacterized protein n=1 Tax=Dreissena polymorpha TaxID=45954 RepID=A0A9D4G136_DREPO|nr:hypothetical protein DPMN_135204 [Dreissena polymorpha]
MILKSHNERLNNGLDKLVPPDTQPPFRPTPNHPSARHPTFAARHPTTLPPDHPLARHPTFANLITSFFLRKTWFTKCKGYSTTPYDELAMTIPPVFSEKQPS